MNGIVQGERMFPKSIVGEWNVEHDAPRLDEDETINEHASAVINTAKEKVKDESFSVERDRWTIDEECSIRSVDRHLWKKSFPFDGKNQIHLFKDLSIQSTESSLPWRISLRSLHRTNLRLKTKIFRSAIVALEKIFFNQWRSTNSFAFLLFVRRGRNKSEQCLAEGEGEGTGFRGHLSMVRYLESS
jgi:hypothetical protein